MSRSRIAGLSLATALVLAGVVAFIVHIQHLHVPGIPPELVPPAWEEFKASAGHQAHVSDRGIACKECHDYERDGFKNPGVTPCLRCHKDEKAHTHGGDDALHTDCLTCHVFAPKEAPTCISCHGKAHGASNAIAIHADVRCTACHHPHQEPNIVPADCTGCHRELTPSHADHPDSRGCLDCHKGHAPASAARTVCATCHTTPAGPKPANHDSCLSCHKPHEFVAGAEKACIGCHGMKPTLATELVSAHNDCLDCHVPHAPTQAASSCTSCHANVHTSHPAVATVPNGNACTTCHAPHGDPRSIASECTSCHQDVATGDTTAHAGGLACTGCHVPHQFGLAPGVAVCTRCHTRETTLASTNTGHTDCTHCHGGNPHRPALAPSCGTCHTKEQSTAPIGHQTCTSCHDAHSGTRGPQATCANCHVRESQDAHAIAVGQCQTCHRPHGPGGVASPPTCLNCHARPKLAGLHASPGHVTCSSCHVPHKPPSADRVTCTSVCHNDKVNHQPGATACNGCHVFK